MHLGKTWLTSLLGVPVGMLPSFLLSVRGFPPSISPRLSFSFSMSLPASLYLSSFLFWTCLLPGTTRVGMSFSFFYFFRLITLEFYY